LKLGGNKNIDQINALKQIENLYKNIEIKYPEYYKSKIIQPFLNISELQKEVKPDETIFSYYLSNDSLFRIVMSKKESYFDAIGNVTEIKSKITTFRHLLLQNSKYDVSNYSKMASELYKLLLGNIPLNLSKNKDYVIITDGILSTIPFEALVENSNDSKTFNSLNYVLKNHNLTYSSSYKIYKHNAKFNAIMNPKIATFSYDIHSKDLPYSNKEVAKIGSIFGEKNVNKFIGKDCNKEQFLKCQNDYDIIHLSLHASSNIYNRDENKIYFSPAFNAPLKGYEILSNNFKSKLIVLSACQTAEGKIETGEGVFSLTRSFIQCGVPNVISTLWQIDDGTNSEIINYFYSYLENNNNINLSINDAKRDYLKHSDNMRSHPKYWSGIVHYK
jgi:CHAT domain-containing protein